MKVSSVSRVLALGGGKAVKDEFLMLKKSPDFLRVTISLLPAVLEGFSWEENPGAISYLLVNLYRLAEGKAEPSLLLEYCH